MLSIQHKIHPNADSPGARTRLAPGFAPMMIPRDAAMAYFILGTPEANANTNSTCGKNESEPAASMS
jgi:hypothetical protein